MSIFSIGDSLLNSQLLSMHTTVHSNNDSLCEIFHTAFRGSFTSALRWHHFDALWEVLHVHAHEGWYIYAVGESPPLIPATTEQMENFLQEMAHLLRTEHKESYCGIVYADSLQQPKFVKIYDPHNLGVSCGYSDNPPLPGWLLTLIPPCDLKALQASKSRQRWWRRLFPLHH
jgi:hypothetical protein